MTENKDLQVIYNYLINDVSNDEIRELIIYLKHYIINEEAIEFELKKTDFDRFKSIVSLFI